MHRQVNRRRLPGNPGIPQCKHTVCSHMPGLQLCELHVSHSCQKWLAALDSFEGPACAWQSCNFLLTHLPVSLMVLHTPITNKDAAKRAITQFKYVLIKLMSIIERMTALARPRLVPAGSKVCCCCAGSLTLLVPVAARGPAARSADVIVCPAGTTIYLRLGQHHKDAQLRTLGHLP